MLPQNLGGKQQLQRFQKILDLGAHFFDPQGMVLHENRLRWLLWACQLKDPEIDGSLIWVFMKSHELQSGQPDTHWDVRGRTFSKLSAAQIQAALNEIRRGITNYVAGHAWRHRGTRTTRQLRRAEGRSWVEYRGPVSEAFVAIAFDLVVREGSKIRRCARRRCEGRKVFLPRRRQEYCSKRCSILERTRRFRENPENLASRNEQRRESYVRQKAEKLKQPIARVKEMIARTRNGRPRKTDAGRET